MNKNITKKVFNVLSIIFGALFFVSGLDKFFHFFPMPDNLPQAMQDMMSAMTQIGWLIPLVGLAEVIGGILIIIPKTRALGAIVIFPIMLGILCVNIYQDQSGLPFALILSAILGWIIYVNRKKYLSLID